MCSTTCLRVAADNVHRHASGVKRVQHAQVREACADEHVQHAVANCKNDLPGRCRR